jgi:hypothetical protein
MEVAPAAETLRTDHVRVDDENLKAKEKSLSVVRIQNLTAEIEAEFAAKREFLLRLRSEKGEPFAEIAYEPSHTNAELRVNTITGVLHSDDPTHLHVLLDGSCLEVFATHKAAITTRVYTVPGSPLVIELSDLDALRSLEVWQMKAISKDRLTT